MIVEVVRFACILGLQFRDSWIHYMVLDLNSEELVCGHDLWEYIWITGFPYIIWNGENEFLVYGIIWSFVSV
jgi:hypothetical protein